MRFWYVLVGLVALVMGVEADAAETLSESARWIWYDSGDPLTAAESGHVWFRYQVKAAQPCTGAVTIACDDKFVVWMNGKKLGEGDAGRFYKFNLAGDVDVGTNVIAIEATNVEGRAGLFIAGGLLYQQRRATTGDSISFDTGANWLATTEQPKGDDWLKRDYDTKGWKPAKVLASHLESPWKALTFTESYLDRYTLAEGFQIERIAEPDLTGTLINMTWGNRGRLIVSRERGPLVSLVDRDDDGKYDEAIEFTSEVTNCQGICMVFDTLYAVGEGPEGVGMYRLPDRNADDKADSVELMILHEGVVPGSKGRVGDHGPHDVVLGPDGWLYHNMGNHARITHEAETTSGVIYYYEGDLLRPRFEDARGHDGHGNPVPAGSVWRFTPDGKKWWRESVGYRNEFDVAFNSDGELFTFDADMEWDVGTPWYRPCRVNHCVPGAEFGWRSGSAKWPEYYFDSLPAMVNIGRGSPTGVVFYEHTQFPEKYRGAFLICDWSRGRILSVKLSPKGATYAGEVETLVTGNPLNASDIEIDRDGTMIFCTGGRNSEGGVYRIRHGDKDKVVKSLPDDAFAMPQLQAGWAREAIGKLKEKAGAQWEPSLKTVARNGSAAEQIRALTLLSQFGPRPNADLLRELAKDDDAQVRAFAVWLLGDHTDAATANTLEQALKDSNLRVRRRACEAFVRSGQAAPIKEIVECLNNDDRWLRYAARGALKRTSTEQWGNAGDLKSQARREVLLAHYQVEPDKFPAEIAMLRVNAALYDGALTEDAQLELLRLIELSLLSGAKGEDVNWGAHNLLNDFPQSNVFIAEETARILAILHPNGTIDKLLSMLDKGSQEEQIHYALCLRYVADGWSYEQRVKYLDWYETTKNWEGGASFAPFLANIVEASLENLPKDQRHQLIESWKTRPHAAQLLVERSGPDDFTDFSKLMEQLIGKLYDEPAGPDRDALLDAAIQAVAKSDAEEVQALFRRLYDDNPDRRNELARVMAKRPVSENWPYLLRTLDFADSATMQLCLVGLSKIDRKAEKPSEYRSVLLSGLQLGANGGGAAVTVLQRWTGKKHHQGLDSAKAIEFYQEWFKDKFPNEPPVELAKDDPSKSRYSLEELNKFLATEPGQEGDPVRGHQMFVKANCIKCHQFLKEGQGIGPDLTSVRRRFQRKEIVESIVMPSKVISDQYRSVTVVTTAGLVYTGLPVKQQDESRVVLILPDATKLELAKREIDEMQPATISVMPENLLRELSLEDVADLFAFLETSKNNDPGQAAGAQATAGGSH